MVGGLALNAAGLGAIALITAVTQNEVGKASGANTMVQELGGAFGVAILVAVFSAAGGFASAEAFSDGFVPAIGVCAALALAGAVAGATLPVSAMKR